MFFWVVGGGVGGGGGGGGGGGCCCCCCCCCSICFSSDVHSDVIVAAEILYGRIRGLNGTRRGAMREGGLRVITVALLFPLVGIAVDDIPKGTRTQIPLFVTLCNYWNPTVFTTATLLVQAAVLKTRALQPRLLINSRSLININVM
jgi:hypothetical protein